MQHKCSSVVEWINKLWDIRTMKYATNEKEYCSVLQQWSIYHLGHVSIAGWLWLCFLSSPIQDTVQQSRGHLRHYQFGGKQKRDTVQRVHLMFLPGRSGVCYFTIMDHSKPCGHSLSSVAQRWITSPLRIAYQEENKDIWATVIQPIVEVGKVNIQLLSWAGGRHGENQCLVPWKQRISKAHVLLRECLSGKIMESSEGSKTRKGRRSKYLNLLMVRHI